MKTSELLKLFKENGIEFEEHRTRHDYYHSPITNKSFPVARHKEDIPVGTLDKILKDAGLK
ncbi:hypothetical protein AGMMS49983_20540 [Clostridia bacterium]|nr:hypothetical protein AGMMS49983_20540 [Clostridia bacterium]